MVGKNDRGEWEMLRVEVKGASGRLAAVAVNDPGNIPPVGGFIVLPSILTINGNLREGSQIADETF